MIAFVGSQGRRARALLAVCAGLVGGGACGTPPAGKNVATDGTVATAPAAATAPSVAPVPAASGEATLDRSALLAVLEGAGRDAWYGVYMQGAKVGHAHATYRPVEGDEPGRWAATMDLDMTLDAGGRKSAMTMTERRFYADAPSYAMVGTEMVLDASGMRDVRRARREGDAFVITRTLNGASQPPRRVAASRDSLAGVLALAPPAPEKLRVGAEETVHAWDWEREADDVVRVTVKAVAERRRAGVPSWEATLVLAYARTGLTLEEQVATGGNLLELRLGPALTLRQEDEAVAKSGITGLDLVGTGVRVTRALGDPERVEALVLDVRGPEGFSWGDRPYQRVEVLPGEAGRWRVTLTRGAGAAVSAEAREEALGEDAILDWRDPAVRAQAEALVAGVTGDRAKVDAILDWVYRTLDKRLATHLPTASTVLARRVGDCTEHTWLTVALLRAAGLPARPVYGLAYAGDADRSFAYHAWVEVAIDGVWWPIDPTWGESVADAAHVILGTDLAAVGGAIGGLQFEVVSVKTAGE